MMHFHVPFDAQGAAVPYILVTECFSAAECGAIGQLFRDLTDSSVSTPGAGHSRKDQMMRRSRELRLARSEENDWIHQRLRELLYRGAEVYGFDMEGVVLDARIVEYRSGDGFAWHCDVGLGEFASRKLSISVELSDARDYEGGRLSVFPEFPWEFDVSARGSAKIFPSFRVHRVSDLSVGVRRSLVCFASADPFR